MNLVEDEMRHDQPPQKSFILLEATTTLCKLAELALNDSFGLWIDLPGDTGVPGNWPRAIDTAADLNKALAQLVANAKSDSVYPCAVWGVRRGFEATTRRAIEAFKVLHWDHELFNAIVAMGGFRIAVWPSSFDLNIRCNDLARAVGWARQALDQPGIVAEWGSDF